MLSSLATPTQIMPLGYIFPSPEAKSPSETCLSAHHHGVCLGSHHTHLSALSTATATRPASQHPNGASLAQHTQTSFELTPFPHHPPIQPPKSKAGPSQETHAVKSQPGQNPGEISHESPLPLPRLYPQPVGGGDKTIY